REIWTFPSNSLDNFRTLSGIKLPLFKNLLVFDRFNFLGHEIELLGCGPIYPLEWCVHEPFISGQRQHAIEALRLTQQNAVREAIGRAGAGNRGTEIGPGIGGQWGAVT